MHVRPKGPVARQPRWLACRLRTVCLAIYWRSHGKSGKLMWTPAGSRSWVDPYQVREEWEAKMATRPDPLKMPSLAKLGADYGSWEKLCPTLAEWLCDACYEDDTAKGDVTLTLKRDGAAVQALLKVEDGGLCLRASGDCPDDAFVALELLLSANPIPWEADKYPLGSYKRKGKKGA